MVPFTAYRVSRERISRKNPGGAVSVLQCTQKHDSRPVEEIGINSPCTVVLKLTDLLFHSAPLLELGERGLQKVINIVTQKLCTLEQTLLYCCHPPKLFFMDMCF